MGTYTIKEYTQRVIPRRIRRFKSMSAPAQASNYMIKMAVSLAPKDTGETINGIRARKVEQNKYKVESFVPGMFKQNMWANRTPPFLNPKMWWNRGKPTIYGSASANWTGEPGWFDLASELTKVKYKQLTIKELHNIMRS